MAYRGHFPICCLIFLYTVLHTPVKDLRTFPGEASRPIARDAREASHVTFALPAPDAHWIFTRRGCKPIVQHPSSPWAPLAKLQDARHDPPPALAVAAVLRPALQRFTPGDQLLRVCGGRRRWATRHRKRQSEHTCSVSFHQARIRGMSWASRSDKAGCT